MEGYSHKGPVTLCELRLAGVDLLARREHGSAELTVKLAKRFGKRDCESEKVQQVIRQLIEEGLLSDERYAVSRARQLAGRGYGPSRIRNDLRQQEVDHYLSDSLSEALDYAMDWNTQATTAYQKKYRGRPIEGDWDARQRERARRLRFLQYRGFGSDISRRLVDADDVGGSSAKEVPDV